MEDRGQHVLNFEIPEALWELSRDEADRQGISVSALIKVLLTKHFDELKEKAK